MERSSNRRCVRAGTKHILFLLCVMSLRPGAAAAQHAPSPSVASATYDVKREIALVGTVLAYTQTPQAPPFGARVTLETSSGTFDVHLGDPKFLAANQFTIQPGDSTRIVGEVVAYGSGSQFVARTVQKGTRALMVRSVRGLPLSYAAPRNSLNSRTQGGVL